MPLVLLCKNFIYVRIFSSYKILFLVFTVFTVKRSSLEHLKSA